MPAPPSMLLLSRMVVNWIVGMAPVARMERSVIRERPCRLSRRPGLRSLRSLHPGYRSDVRRPHRSGLCPPRRKDQQRSNPLVPHARIQKRTGVARRQYRALRAARPVVPQHAAEQRLPNPTTPVRRIDIHIGAPRRPRRVHAPDAADDVLTVQRDVLAERGVIPKQVIRDGPSARPSPAAPPAWVRTRSISTEMAVGIRLSRCTKSLRSR